MKFAKIIIFTILCVPSILICQTKDSTDNPCKDKRFVELQKKNLDSLTQREYDYFLEMVKQCNDYKQLKSKDEILDEASDNTVGIILSIAGGIVVLALLIGVIDHLSSK